MHLDVAPCVIAPVGRVEVEPAGLATGTVYLQIENN